MTGTDSLFDKLAADYGRYRAAYSAQLYDQLEQLGFKRGMNVLDVGCGTGIATAALLERGMNVTGIDSSEQMLAAARRAVPTGRFVQGNAEQLPVGDKEFDAVVSAQAIHWFDQGKAIEEMIRAVKPGGRIAIWWRKLVTDEAMRSVEAEACVAAGVEQPKEIMPGSFLAFYRVPFKERSVRVIPQMITTDAQTWLGFERTRAWTNEALGEAHVRYHAELERLVTEKSEGRPFQVRFTQFLYVGELG